MKKVLPAMGFEPGAFRLSSERATTELRGLMYLVSIKLHIVLPVQFFLNIPVANGRYSKRICRVLLS